MHLNLKAPLHLSLLLAAVMLLCAGEASAQFVRLYGNNQENSFGKVIPTGPGYYALGSNAGVATITYVNLNGQHQWTRLLNMPSVLTDAVLMTNSSNLLFVGYTLPLSSANQSIIGTVDPSGFVSSVIAYDTPGQEELTKVVANPSPSGGYSVLGYHSPNGPEEVVLLTLDANAVITDKDRLAGIGSVFTNDLDLFGN
ncbi:MAG: hypothetical protein KDC54_14315, partial [Lewinella sp.]|nr:hypothetical protein [Lewinella sp.]